MPRYLTRDSKRIHVAVAERALGRRLPKGAEVHHVDGDKHNNANSNLVICQDAAYHKLLHRRTRIVKAGGDPNTQRICCHCQRVLDLSMFRARRPCRGHVDTYGNQCRACCARKANEYYIRRGRILAGCTDPYKPMAKRREDAA